MSTKNSLGFAVIVKENLEFSDCGNGCLRLLHVIEVNGLAYHLLHTNIDLHEQ